jgi:hypothetical protein
MLGIRQFIIMLCIHYIDRLLPTSIGKQFNQFYPAHIITYLCDFFTSKLPDSAYLSCQIQLNTMDIGLLASSLSGVNFMPSSQPPPANGMKCWLDDLNDKFIDMVCPQKKLQLLTPHRCSDY